MSSTTIAYPENVVTKRDVTGKIEKAIVCDPVETARNMANRYCSTFAKYRRKTK
jgi:hypothetical protein